MTTIDKNRLLAALEDRIAELATNTTWDPALVAPGERAHELSGLVRAIHNGNYDVNTENTDDVTDGPAQDPLEAAADRILSAPKFMDTVRELPVGDVVSVQTILWRRADEHEKQAAIIRERRAQTEEAVQGLLTAEQPARAPMYEDESDDARYETPDEYEVYRKEARLLGDDRPMSRERFYAQTGLRDRNGGR